MGGFEGLSFDEGADGGSGAVLRIDGLAIFGGVEIRQRLPGESAKEARRRRKAAM